MIGIAGSGKTTVATMLFPEHKHVSLDEIPKSNREIENNLIKQHLKNGDNVLIDDTNLTKTIRHTHIELAKSYHAKITAVFVDLPMWRIQEQNSNREKPLPESVLFKMQKQLEIPTTDEGIDFIQRLNNTVL